jgi:hypothetical protein
MPKVEDEYEHDDSLHPIKAFLQIRGDDGTRCSVDILTGPQAGAPEPKERVPGAPRLFWRSAGGAGMPETAIGPNEVMNALRRYLEKTGESGRTAAVKMGVSRHSLCRWLTDSQSPQKGDLLLVAAFLRRAGFL